MGTDITMYAEVRDYRTGHWQLAESDLYYPNRNYFLFALLAGVRNAYDIVPIAKPRGLPRDVSGAIWLAHDDEGWPGSTSYLTLAELRAFDWDQPLPTTYMPGVGLGDEIERTYRDACRIFLDTVVADCLNGLVPADGSADDVRIVFWFDG